MSRFYNSIFLHYNRVSANCEREEVLLYEERELNCVERYVQNEKGVAKNNHHPGNSNDRMSGGAETLGTVSTSGENWNTNWQFSAPTATITRVVPGPATNGFMTCINAPDYGLSASGDCAAIQNAIAAGPCGAAMTWWLIPFTRDTDSMVRITVNTFGEVAVRYAARFCWSADAGNQ